MRQKLIGTVVLFLFALAGCSPQNIHEAVEKGDVKAVEACPVARALGTEKLSWGGTRPPSVAVSAKGAVYVVWAGKGRLRVPKPPGLPLIPEEYTFAARDPKWVGVPGISVCRGGRWSSPGLLVKGLRECSPVHAWCDGEALHLLVVNELANRCNHLVLDPSAQKWRLKARLPFAPSQYSARQNVGRSLHMACVEGGRVHYLSFDGNAWSTPLRIENSRNTLRVRLAVDDRGVAHLLWWTTRPAPHGVHGYAVVSKGGVRVEAVDFGDPAIYREEFNLGLLPDGKLFLAYKARIPNTHPDAKKLHIRYRENGKWTVPTLIDGQAGVLHGGVYTAHSSRRSFVSWIAMEDYAVGRGVTSASVRRYSTTDGSTWSKSKWIANHDRGILGFMTRSHNPVGPIWSGICVDGRNRVHMAWGQTPSRFYAIVADLSAAQAGPGKPDALETAPDKKPHARGSKAGGN